MDEFLRAEIRGLKDVYGELLELKELSDKVHSYLFLAIDENGDMIKAIEHNLSVDELKTLARAIMKSAKDQERSLENISS